LNTIIEQGETIVVMVIVYHEELEKQGEAMIAMLTTNHEECERQSMRMWTCQ
jgi:hypothetical protein